MKSAAIQKPVLGVAIAAILLAMICTFGQVEDNAGRLLGEQLQTLVHWPGVV